MTWLNCKKKLLQQEVTTRTGGFRLVIILRLTAPSLLEEQGTSYSTLWKIYLSAFLSFGSQWSFVIFNRFMYSFPSALSNNNTYKAIKGKGKDKEQSHPLCHKSRVGEYMCAFVCACVQERGCLLHRPAQNEIIYVPSTCKCIFHLGNKLHPRIIYPNNGAARTPLLIFKNQLCLFKRDFCLSMNWSNLTSNFNLMFTAILLSPHHL